MKRTAETPLTSNNKKRKLENPNDQPKRDLLMNQIHRMGHLFIVINGSRIKWDEYLKPRFDLTRDVIKTQNILESEQFNRISRQCGAFYFEGSQLKFQADKGDGIRIKESGKLRKLKKEEIVSLEFGQNLNVQYDLNCYVLVHVTNAQKVWSDFQLHLNKKCYLSTPVKRKGANRESSDERHSFAKNRRIANITSEEILPANNNMIIIFDYKEDMDFSFIAQIIDMNSEKITFRLLTNCECSDLPPLLHKFYWYIEAPTSEEDVPSVILKGVQYRYQNPKFGRISLLISNNDRTRKQAREHGLQACKLEELELTIPKYTLDSRRTDNHSQGVVLPKGNTPSRDQNQYTEQQFQ